MKKILRAAFAAAVGAIGLVACDAAAPPDAAVSRPVEPEAIAVSPPAGSEAIVARETLAEVLRDEDSYSRARRLGELLPTLGPEAVPPVQETLGDLTLDFGGAELELLVRFWATHQPEDACRWALLKAPRVYRMSAVYSALRTWAEADPPAALNATRQWTVHSDDMQDVIQVALVRGWFAANPSQVEEYIYQLGLGFQRQHALIAFMRIVIQKRGADALLRWAESIPDDQATYKKAVYGQVGSVLPLFDQEAAIRWCETQCDGPYGAYLRSMIARRWVRSDGPAALAWLSSAPEGHEKDFALRVAFEVWGGEDREAALAWMAAQTTGEPAPWLRPIFPGYALLLAQDSPLQGIEWAERIEDEQERDEVLIRIARDWRRADEAAAEAWLSQSPLSEEDRKRARAPRGRPGRQRRPGG